MPTSEEQKYAPTAWGQMEGEDLRVPSGQLCRVRRATPQALIADGTINSMDSLTQIVNQYTDKVEGKNVMSDDKVAELLEKEPDKMIEILHLVDRVVCSIVLEPQIHMAPNDVTSRQKGVIYADTIDIDDKMFIFNNAMGGSADLKRFRQESQDAVGELAAVPENGRAAFRARRDQGQA